MAYAADFRLLACDIPWDEAALWINSVKDCVMMSKIFFLLSMKIYSFLQRPSVELCDVIIAYFSDLLSGIVLNRKRISTKKEVLLVLTGLRKTPERERERERREESER